MRQTTATGGNALLHFANYILEFEPRFKKDLILENPTQPINPTKNKLLGHNVKVTVKKSPNEKTNYVLEYPIRYGREGGNSVWIEREVIDMLYGWEFLHRKGAWITLDPELSNLLEEEGLSMPDKIQGEPKLNALLEADDKLRKFLISYFQEMLSSFSEDAE